MNDSASRVVSVRNGEDDAVIRVVVPEMTAQILFQLRIQSLAWDEQRGSGPFFLVERGYAAATDPQSMKGIAIQKNHDNQHSRANDTVDDLDHSSSTRRVETADGVHYPCQFTTC